MDLTTVVGTLLVAVLLLWSLTAGGTPLAMFVDVPSLVMVGGGTIAVTMMSFRIGDLKGLVSVLLRTYLFKLPSPGQEIERIIAYANLARKEGLLALEAKLEEVDDTFFSKGVQLVIDGFGADTVRDIMDLELQWQNQRHSSGKKMLDAMGSMAPAFGMIGTLVGLVKMLANLSDPSSIGAGMAVALLTTFYGAVLANAVFIPLSGKLDIRAKEEMLLRELMIEGIVAIQSGEKPQLIKEKLKGFLPPAIRESVAAG
jgi:chemotaxis protein MotA